MNHGDFLSSGTKRHFTSAGRKKRELAVLVRKKRELAALTVPPYICGVSCPQASLTLARSSLQSRRDDSLFPSP